MRLRNFNNTNRNEEEYVNTELVRMQSCRAHELFIFSLQTYMTCKTKHVGMQKQDFENRCNFR